MLAEWRPSLLDTGLKVTVGKSEVMVGGSGGEMIVTLESGPVVSVEKDYMQTLFSAQYVKNGFSSRAVVCMVTCRG